VEQAVNELRNIYSASNAEGAVQMYVTPGGGHAIDVEHLLSHMAGRPTAGMDRARVESSGKVRVSRRGAGH
jgi:hypothetical protein